MKQQLTYNETIVSFLLDESGSMSSVQEETVEGIRDYIKELKTDPSPTIMRLQKFNSEHFSVSYDFEDINQVTEMTYDEYSPNGLTPLLDSVGRTIEETSNYIETNCADKPNVIITIMTDGFENASSDYSHSKIKKMIAEKQNLGWEFTYMGANHDSWAVASHFGLPRANVNNYAYANPKEALLKNAELLIDIKRKMREGRN